MDLISLLTNTGNGLVALQAKASTIGNNIANASTPGYARQNANLQEAIPSTLAGNRGFIGGGVNLGSITQARDQFIEAQLPTAFSHSSGSTARSDALNSISTFNNGSEGDLTDALGAFYSKLTALAQNPGDPSLRQSAVQSANWLVSAFNRTSASIELARTGIDANLRDTVQQVNASAQQVADLNRRIAATAAGGAQPTDLLDQRHNLIDKMAQLIGTTQVPDAYGNISLVLPGGVTLVSAGKAATLSIEGDNTNKGHLNVVSTPSAGSAPVILNQVEVGGQVAGLLSARDLDLGPASLDLDTLAYDFANAINAQNRAGFDLNGNPGGDIFVVGATSASAASTLAFNPDLLRDPSLLAAAGSAETAPGDASNLQTMVDTQQQALSNGLDVQKGMAKIVSDFGVAALDAKNAAAFDQSALQNLESARNSVSGVSIDEEMVNLMQVQHSFTALSKVVETGNQLLETLMNLKK
jgi:flagellar hook-associated protein 1 FlgK